jgi:hypothetical protein
MGYLIGLAEEKKVLCCEEVFGSFELMWFLVDLKSHLV